MSLSSYLINQAQAEGEIIRSTHFPSKNKYWIEIALKMLIDDTGLNNTSKPNSNSTDVPNWCLSH